MDTLLDAIFTDDINLVEFLCQIGIGQHSTVYNQAIQHQNLDIVKLLDKYDYPKDESFFGIAIKTDNVEIIDYFYQLGYVHESSDIPGIIRSGSFNIFRYYYEKGIRSNKSIQTACRYDNEKIVKYLIDKKEVVCFLSWHLLIAHRKYDLLKYILDAGYTFSEEVFKVAIKLEDLEIITLLHEYCVIEVDMLDVAIEANNFKIFVWLYEHGYMHNTLVEEPERLFDNVDCEIERFAHNNDIPCRWNCNNCYYCIENKEALLSELTMKDDNYLIWLHEADIESLL